MKHRMNERRARRLAGIEDEFPGFERGTDFYDPRTDYFFTVDRFEDGMLIAYNDLWMFYGWTPETFKEFVTEPNMRNFGNVYGPEEPRYASRRKRAVMNRDDILDLIYDLSRSQGFYGRMLDDLMYQREVDPDGYDDLMRYWESMRFSDPLDFIMFVEGDYI